VQESSCTYGIYCMVGAWITVQGLTESRSDVSLLSAKEAAKPLPLL
jgi:hypothetical protein